MERITFFVLFIHSYFLYGPISTIIAGKIFLIILEWFATSSFKDLHSCFAQNPSQLQGGQSFYYIPLSSLRSKVIDRTRNNMITLDLTSHRGEDYVQVAIPIHTV